MIRVLTSREPMPKDTLAERLDALTRPGELYTRLEDGSVRCFACGHRCLIRDGRRGICQVRYNRDGVLYVPFGYVAALQVDPTAKKPFYHVLPGSTSLTFGMLGCDFHCGYCQNWLTSQALRDPVAGVAPQEVDAERLAALAHRYGASLVASSYNEPLITSEWAVAVFRAAKATGLRCAFVSNGNGTPEALAYLRPWLDAYKIDLKTMRDANYRKLGGVLNHVLDTVRLVHSLGLWLEIVTLVVPGFNDSEAEMREAARFIASVSPDIPWHVTAFHKDYKMTDPDNTPAQTLIRAAEIGREEGLRYVYAGNLPGQVGEWEDTRCPHCQTVVIERWGFEVLANRLQPDGLCPVCRTALPGIWH